MLIKRANLFRADGIKVIPVNMIGVMGAGIAKVIRDNHNDVYQRYKTLCALDHITPDNPVLLDDFLMFVTKRDWKDNSKIEYIESGLRALRERYVEIGIDRTVNFPLVGTGCGGLSIPDVTRLLIRELNMSDYDSTIVLPERRNK